MQPTYATTDGVPQPKQEAPGGARRISELDGLRGIAFLLVLCFHYIAVSPGGDFGSSLYRFRQAFRLGWSGVDLFFVLSGFLIGGILLEARDSENYFSTFYNRRVHRIFPLYYAFILLYFMIRVVGARWIPSSLPIADGGIRHVPLYLLFLQNFFSMPFGTFDWYWFLVTWSLAIEEQFYLVAPILIRALSKVSLTVTLCATVVLAPVLRELAYRFTPSDDAYWYNLMPCRADALAIGMLAALAWKTPEIRSFLLARKALIYSALFFFSCGIPVLLKYFPNAANHFTVSWEFSWLAFFYVTLLLAVLVDPNAKLGRVMRMKWLMRVGTVSYCLYLIHVPVAALLHAALLGDRPSIATPAAAGVTLLAALLCFALAALSWKYFEGPLVTRAHRYGYTSRVSFVQEMPPAAAGISNVNLTGIGTGTGHE